MQREDEKKVLTRIPLDLFQQIEALADREHRSVNGQIVYLLERAMERQRKIDERIREMPEEHKNAQFVAA